jgi:hypothetical protein
VKRLLEEGDQGSHESRTCKDLEQDCEESSQHFYFQSVGFLSNKVGKNRECE